MAWVSYFSSFLIALTTGNTYQTSKWICQVGSWICDSGAQKRDDLNLGTERIQMVFKVIELNEIT